MSKKISSVYCSNQRIDLQEVNGTLFISSTSTEKDFRGQQQNHPTVQLLALSDAEGRLLADAINTYVNPEKSIPIATAKEKIVLAAPESSEGNAD